MLFCKSVLAASIKHMTLKVLLGYFLMFVYIFHVGKHAIQLQNVQINSTLKMWFKFNLNFLFVFHRRQKSGLQVLRNSSAQYKFH